MKNPINTLSLFTGAGGLDIGFHRAGFNILACVEIEEKYCKTLERNREQGNHLGTHTSIHNIDIRKFDVSKYVNKNIECVIGGPPCQTFSAAGRRAGGVLGTDDERGLLYEAYCKILDKIKPKVFVFENVYGIKGANGGQPWEEITQAFSDHGYTLYAEVLDAADFGVPQHRERLIMIGTKAKPYKFPIPTVGPDSQTGDRLVSVLDAIKDLQKRGEKPGTGLGGMYGHLLPEVPEGLNYSFFTAEMGHPEPVFAWRSKFHDLLYKVDRNEPCRTIKANPGKFTGPFHWKNRHFTVDELKRLQTFPDDYELIGSYGQVVEQIGNSVPPLLAYVIAESVKEQILHPSKTLKYPTRPDDFRSTFRQRQRIRTAEFNIVAQEAIKKKYGESLGYESSKRSKQKAKNYFIVFKTRFERTTLLKRNVELKNYLQVTLVESGQQIRLNIDSISKKKSDTFAISIEVSGLKKYLPMFDTLKLEATISDTENIFQCWKEIENVLVDRSNFFTLIDIYGHYANRGDVVDIKTNISSKKRNKLLLLIDYFSQTENCGGFLNEPALEDFFNVSRSQLYDLIDQMRLLRYDIRTFETHPIIGQGKIICTYPFPLLSPKAMVESKAKLYKEVA